MAAENLPGSHEAALRLLSEIKHRIPSENYARFIKAIQRHLPGGGRQPESFRETAMVVEEVLEGQSDLIQKFYRLIYRHDSGCKAAVDFINRIGMRDRGLQKTVLQIFDSYNREEIGEDELRCEVVELLKRDSELLDGIGRFLPVTEATPISVVVPQQEKPYSRKIGDRGDQKAEIEEEQRVSKRAKPVNENNLQREEFMEFILKNREKFPPSNLYRYSTGGDFREEISRSLFQLKSPTAAVPEEKDERRVINKETEKEKKTLIFGSKRLTPSYLLLLQPETKSNSPSPSILNTTCVSMAAEGCDFSAGAERRRRRRVDPREEKLNRMEDDLYEADMAKRHLMSAAEYAVVGKSGNPRGKFRYERCVEAMYGGGTEVDRKVLGQVVKTRLYQKIGELKVQRLKMTAKEYL